MGRGGRKQHQKIGSLLSERYEHCENILHLMILLLLNPFRDVLKILC